IIFRYDAYKSDQKIDDDFVIAGSTGTRHGGNVFAAAAFYEFNFRKLTIGASFNYSQQSESKMKSDQTGVIDFANDAISTLGYETYVPIHFNPDITLLPQAGFKSYNLPPDNDFTYMTDWYAGCGARFTF